MLVSNFAMTRRPLLNPWGWAKGPAYLSARWTRARANGPNIRSGDACRDAAAACLGGFENLDDLIGE